MGEFIGLQAPDQQADASLASTELRVTLNWFEELKAKVPPLDGGTSQR